jgi:hypothetical protein
MLHRVLPLFAVAAFLPSASQAITCPAPEKAGQTPGGYSICKPSATGQCAPGRKFTRHPRELVNMCEAGSPTQAAKPTAAPAAKGPCAPGERAENYKGYDVCRPNGGACGKGRRNVMHHRYPDLIVCENDPHASQTGHVEITCPEHERPVLPKVKSAKPFCEPVGGRCGFGRTAVNVDAAGRQKMCVPK